MSEETNVVTPEVVEEVTASEVVVEETPVTESAVEETN